MEVTDELYCQQPSSSPPVIPFLLPFPCHATTVLLSETEQVKERKEASRGQQTVRAVFVSSSSQTSIWALIAHWSYINDVPPPFKVGLVQDSIASQ